MHKKILSILLITSLFITTLSCKTKSKDTDADKSNQSITDLIKKLQGGIPKNPVEMFEANFSDLKNNQNKLSDFKGKVIFLNLWATWCPPCRGEMPAMEKLYKKFKDTNFTMVAVSQGEDLNTVKKFLEQNKYSFPIFIDNKNEIAKAYGSGSIPTTYLINKSGYIIAQFVGGREWDSSDVEDLINALLNE